MSHSASIAPASAQDDAAISGLAALAELRVEPAEERAREQSVLLVAREDSIVVGFILGWVVAGELEVLDVCVRKSARRRGIGRALLNRLMADASKLGAQDAFLEVRVSNQPAKSLYLGLGFSEVGVRERYYKDGEDALLFRCCLPAAS